MQEIKILLVLKDRSGVLVNKSVLFVDSPLKLRSCIIRQKELMVRLKLELTQRLCEPSLDLGPALAKTKVHRCMRVQRG